MPFQIRGSKLVNPELELDNPHPSKGMTQLEETRHVNQRFHSLLQYGASCFLMKWFRWQKVIYSKMN